MTSTRYEQAYCQAWDNLPGWKRIAVREDMAAGYEDSRFVQEFVQNVLTLAESSASLKPKCKIEETPCLQHDLAGVE
jgi:hypothetical protein